MTYYIGLDLGQAADPSAVAVLERLPARGIWALRYFTRFPLATPYPVIVDFIGSMTSAFPLKGDSHLVVDATGVGRPVLDLLRRPGLGSRLVGVTIHGGDHAVRDPAIGGYRVPKKEIVSNLQLLLQRGRLRISAELADREVLLTEMASFRVRVSPTTGHEAFGSEGRDHDDVVVAVGLAAWLGERYSPLPAGSPMDVPPDAPGGRAAEAFEALQALDRATNPDFIAMADFRPGGPSGNSIGYGTRPGITGPVSHVVRTRRG